MLQALGAAIGKDLRLLARDRVALVFLTLAPIIVITVAGFSLATLYGAGPHGDTAYVLSRLYHTEASQAARRIQGARSAFISRSSVSPAGSGAPPGSRRYARHCIRSGAEYRKER